MNFFEKLVRLANRRAHAVMNVWLGTFAASLQLEEGYFDQLCLPKAGVFYPLTGQNCQPHSCHNDFEHIKQGNLVFRYLLTCAENTSLCVCPGNHKFVHYLEMDRKKLTDVLNMVEV